MLSTTPRWRGDPAGRPLLMVLILLLGVSASLAYQAIQAGRSHQEVIEATLRDYATFAEWELGRRIESSVSRTIRLALLPASFWTMPDQAGQDVEGDTELARFAFGVENMLTTCGCQGAASDFFFIDVESGELSIARDDVTAEYREWLTTTATREARPTLRDTVVRPSEVLRRQEVPPGEVRLMLRDTIVTPGRPAEGGGTGRMMVVQIQNPDELGGISAVPLDPARSVVFTQIRQPNSNRIYGFTVDVARLVGPLVGAEVAASPLLPPALVGEAGNSDVLSLAVWLESGDTIFRMGGPAAAGMAVVESLELPVGRLAMRTAVRPEMAPRLVIGGLPRSRLPILLGSLALTLVLLVVAIGQLRRQHAFFRTRTEFVSGVSHELRTPLAQIRLFSDLLASGRLEPAQRDRSLRILTEETKRLTYLVDNVLRFSRSERGENRIVKVATDLTTLLREIVADFQPLARSRDVTIEVEAPDAIHVLLDPDAMRQIVLNLLDNAVKYGPRGQRIEVRARPDGDDVRVEITDEGPGIPAADRERIWEPYRRLSRPFEEATGGSGIGLAVVREIVALHGGAAFVADSPVGARFVVRLPGRIGTPSGVGQEMVEVEA